MAQLSDFSTLDEARAHIERTEKPESGRMINERGVFALIGMEAGERLMTAIEQAPNIPARVKAWFKPSEHGIDILATAAQAILAGMVAEQIITQAEADTLTGHAYIVTRPFENVTLYDFQRDNGLLSFIRLNVTDGYALIRVTADCEWHNPKIYTTNPRTNKRQFVAGFNGVSEAGIYEAFIPPEWRNSVLEVGNSYNVFEAI